MTPVQGDVMKNNEITLAEDELDYNSIDEDENWKEWRDRIIEGEETEEEYIDTTMEKLMKGEIKI